MRATAPAMKASDVFSHFIDQFETTVDDLPDVATSGTATDHAQLIDNDVALGINSSLNQYVEIDFAGMVHITEIRYHGDSFHNQDGHSKLEAYVNGAWVDVLTLLPTILDVWSSWLDLATPLSAILWRWTTTLADTNALTKNLTNELEFKGIRLQ